MIKLIKPYIEYGEVESSLKEIFNEGWFTKGKYVDKFRYLLKDYTSASNAYLTTSATTALWTCLKILGIGKGDQVIVSDFSFPASINVIEDLEAIPVFADVSLDDFNMLEEELISKITKNTKAVIFVDALGNLSRIDRIQEICKKYHIPLIEDAACAIGSSIEGKKCGSYSDFTCFSFHPRKLLTTGEGGAILVNSETYNDVIEIKLNHGSVFQNGKFDFIDYGYNFRMSEIQAAMGIIQLQKIDNIVIGRNRIRDEYIKKLNRIGFLPQKISNNVTYNVQSAVFKVPVNIDRDLLIVDLRKKKIESTIGTYSLSSTTYYKNKYKLIQKNSLELQQQTLTLPCYENVDVDYITDSITDLVKSYGK